MINTKKILPLFVITLATVSCTKEKSSNVQDVGQDSMTVNSSDFAVEPLPENCYVAASGKDSVFMKVINNLGTVNGQLYYKNYQKDSSSGEIIGVQDGDTLKVDYTFQSEGTTSTREIWFLIKDGKVSEGIGKSNAEGTAYADYKTVKYEGGHEFSSVDCKKIEKQLSSVQVAKDHAATLENSEKSAERVDSQGK